MSVTQTLILLIPVFFLMGLSVFLNRGQIGHNVRKLWAEIRGER